MFEPGHVHRAVEKNEFNPQGFTVDVYYDVREDPTEGKMLHMRMEGDIDGRHFADECELYRDVAYDFMRALNQIAVRNGFNPRQGPVLRDHREYDAMYHDIRTKLDLKPGEPINFDHLNF
ncbi:DUF5064 family protein [Azotobacter bryophylli]|uniref:DUF5064 family protein n=1 Tax=Azotobacter bryophylli TaxID=1986537 RepID=A0ABV7AU69_9GAMM